MSDHPPFPAADDAVDVFVGYDDKGYIGVFAIKGSLSRPRSQSATAWCTSNVNTTFYAQIKRGKKISHTMWLSGSLPEGETAGLSPDGYGFLELHTREIQEKLRDVPHNTKIRLH
jgi:hypothetical protein